MGGGSSWLWAGMFDKVQKRKKKKPNEVLNPLSSFTLISGTVRLCAEHKPGRGMNPGCPSVDEVTADRMT